MDKEYAYSIDKPTENGHGIDNDFLLHKETGSKDLQSQIESQPSQYYRIKIENQSLGGIQVYLKNKK